MNTTKQKYNPQSHFFVNAEALIMADEKYKSTDAYGPVLGEEETKYRVTSFVRTDRVTEVYAICDGEILIQPQENNNDKINLILKPSTGTYAPLRIKYFVYRGVRKSDLIWDDKYLCPVDANIDSIDTMAQPQLLKNLWKEFCEMDAPNSDVLFPLSLIGYDQSENTRLDEMFSGNEDFQLPTCKAGMHIGFFEDKIGLDIVLDDGDLIPEFGRELFKLDLQYARKEECVFNLNDITDNNETLQNTYRKRYKENILKFIDAAAFWGSHIEFGNIQKNNNETFNNAEDIYNVFLNKYQTANTVYVQITNEYGRSFSYYNCSEEKVHIELRADSNNSYEEQIEYSDFGTNGWPIACLNGNTGEICLFVQFRKTDIGDDNNYIMYGINFDADNIYASLVYLKSYFNQILSCYNNIITSNFFQMLIAKNTNNDFLINKLWRTGLKPFLKKHFVIGTNGYPTARYLDNSYIADVYKKTIVFDIGENKSVDIESKERHLYIAQEIGITSNTSEITSLYENNIEYETYVRHLYGENVLIKDVFMDNEEKIYSLTLLKEIPYYQLGITEDDYDNLTLGNDGFPKEEVDNIFFYLTEVSTEGISDNMVKKYELGIRFEDGTGQMVEALCPSIPIYVYTIDEHYFFTKEYSNYQHLYYKKLGAMFYPTENYDGEFGFDWMRDGVFRADYIKNSAYKDIMGVLKKYENNEYGDTITEGNTYDEKDEKIRFFPMKELYGQLQKEYEQIHIHQDESIENYFVPKLSIYPYSGNATGTGSSSDASFKAVFHKIDDMYDYDENRVAKLYLRIVVTDEHIPQNIYLEYDTENINVKIENEDGREIQELQFDIGVNIYTLTIKCMNPIQNENEYLFVYANYKKNKTVLGKLHIMPNAVEQEMEIILVPIQTEIDDGNIDKEGCERIAKTIKRYLRHAFISPKFTIKDKFVITSRDYPKFYTDYVKDNKILLYQYDNSGKYYPKAKKIFDKYLSDYALENTRVVFISCLKGGIIKQDGKFYVLNGINMNKYAILFDKLEGVTAAHEVLHSLGLLHSFTARVVDKNGNVINPNAYYTYRPKYTDNIMDYTKKRNSLWNWQIKIINEHI